jgi:acetyl-CoA synthetase
MRGDPVSGPETKDAHPTFHAVNGPPVGRDTGSPGIAWRPTRRYLQRSRLGRFMRRHGIGSVDQLVWHSTSDVQWFWDAVVRDLELEWFEPYSRVLDLSGGVEWPRWFVGGRYNHVHDAVDKQARLRPHDMALVWEGEDGQVRTLTFAQLCVEVSRAANALKALGISVGDRVGVFMPMLPETAIAVLATAKRGAICTPIFSGFGGAAVAERLADCGAKLLITADGFYRSGRWVPMKQVADEAASATPGVEHVLVVRRPKGDAQRAVTWTAGRDVWWHDFVLAQPGEYPTEHTAADDPYMIIYTSGTTGKPKGVVHVHGGFPIKAAQELAHCFDLHPGDRLFWHSDIGWMMGPWAISGALMLGATCFLYEGAISHPNPGRLWSMVQRHHITHLGISPTAVRSLMGHGDAWVRAHNLSSLLVLAGAGEPWDPASWRWLFEVAGGGERPLINYSGGTEVAGAILSSNTLLPIKPCAFSAPAPGMAADVIDEQGNPVRGESGELAIRGPWPGMTRGFWGDPQRYIETYWSQVPDVWVHGDRAQIDEDGYWYILGRSDDTIKVAGKRLGPAEVESAAVGHPAVREAAAIGVPDPLKGEAVVVFVVLHEGQVPTEALRADIEAAVVARLGRAFCPQAVRFATELPHTRNGKILRRLVRRCYLGQPAGDTSSLENPSALEAIAQAN